MRGFLVAMLVVLHVAPAGAQGLPRARPRDVGLDSARLARIAPMLHRAVERGEISGIVTLVARHGRIAAVDSAGFLDLGRRTPIGSATLFRIASMSKPITSVAAMSLVEEGRLRLADPVARYIPAFADMKVADPGTGASGRGAPVPARRPITIFDLLTHRSGLTYGFLDEGPVGDAYRAAGISDGLPLRDEAVGANVDRLAALPLVAQPGARFQYGLSTDVLGRVIEIVSGRSLADFLQERLFDPLGMDDTGFYVEEDQLERLATPYAWDRKGLRPMRPREQLGNLLLAGDGYPGSRRYFSGGSGLVSTVGDYARFLQMMLNGGELDGVRILGPKTVELIVANALEDVEHPLGPGAGFGLGFMVTTELGPSAEPGSVGTLSWSGIYGTMFWADPAEQLIGITMLQRFPTAGLTLGDSFRAIAYGAVID
ncbi:MAG TPA: serine hydrolase domain-containing protein [Gemmatimonadales bacterium]|nr:serine hydrolase domain-containing protein [Gemmatimonadales bacterium]